MKHQFNHFRKSRIYNTGRNLRFSTLYELFGSSSIRGYALEYDYTGAARRKVSREESCEASRAMHVYSDVKKSEERNATASHSSQYVSKCLRGKVRARRKYCN